VSLSGALFFRARSRPLLGGGSSIACQPNAISSRSESLCCFCNESEEDLQHLMCSYKLTWEVWMLCFKWWGFSVVINRDPSDLLLLPWIGASKATKVVLVVVWAAICWSIWCTRNSVIFDKAKANSNKVFDIAQTRAFEWMVARASIDKREEQNWISNPQSIVRQIGHVKH
ncbi:hypothetical protein Ancab_004649, partial [Ancistrocladus abbreviatus]